MITTNNRGAILLTTIAMLIVFALFGIHAMENIIVEERIVGRNQLSSELYWQTYNELEAQYQWLAANPTELVKAKLNTLSLSAILIPACVNRGDPCASSTVAFVEETTPPPGYSVITYRADLYAIDTAVQLKDQEGSALQRRHIIHVDKR